VRPESIQVAAGKLLDAPAESAGLPDGAPAAHPVIAAQTTAITEVQAREKALERAWYPRFDLDAAEYGRGTGIQPNGATGNAASGLGPNIQNWAIGMTVTFPLADLPGLKARKEIERARERTERARYDLLVQNFNGELARARAILTGARRVAANLPVQLEAARETEQQATARYKSGLGTLIEVAEAQRLHTQAEIDSSLARLNIWRALLGLAIAQGDVASFVQLTK